MNEEFMAALQQVEKEKGIPRHILIEAIESALVSAYKKDQKDVSNIRVQMEPDTGAMHVYGYKNIVGEVEDPQTQCSLEEAQKLDPHYSVGDVAEQEIQPREFGRIAAQTAKQVVVQRIREAERILIYEEYVNREGDIVTGIVQRFEQRNVLLDLGKADAILTQNEQVTSEHYEQGLRLKVYIVEVRKTTKGPQIFVSRTHPGLLKRLFELEVPEIHDGIVEIKSIAREAGARSKVTVWSREENVDP
ncbi:MAG TPA: transcription termination factor NusA, partial [Firmicutes bacterium]|nr:transcription termination factor NusA [Bacillota bacterium]